MPTRISTLTTEQRARMGPWADAWIAKGLCTDPADRATFEAAVARCYGFTGLSWHGNVVWVDSPLVMALAAPIAAVLLENRSAFGLPRGSAPGIGLSLRPPLRPPPKAAGAIDGAVDGAVDGAISRAINGAVGGAINGATGTVSVSADAINGAVNGAIYGAVNGAVDGAVGWAVNGAISRAIDGAVGGAVSGTIDGSINGTINVAINGAINGAVSRAVNGAISGAVGGAIDGAVGGAVSGAIDGAISRAIDGAVGGAISRAIDGAISGTIGRAVSGAVGGAIDGAIDGAVSRAVDRAVSRAISGAVGGAVSRAVSGNWFRYLDGTFRLSWQAYTSFFREVCQLEIPGDTWDRDRAYAAAQSAVGYWWPHKEFIMASERPSVIRLERVGPPGWGSHRLHSESGPAVGYRDGWGVWAIHGVQVPRELVEAPETITAARIRGEPNAEVRRIMIDRFGQERFLRESDAVRLSKDDWGTLWVLDLPGDEPLVMVEVLNATAEPDGTFKTYFIRVPPTMATAHQAVAWTFGRTPDTYLPMVQA